MENSDYKTFVTNSKIRHLKEKTVIKNYYLVIGGGKVGTNFLEYAINNKFPFVLVVDRDKNAPASRDAKVLKNESELVNLLKSRAASLPIKAELFPSLKQEREKINNEPKAYFYKMDIHHIPFLFTLGIPEYIIPAVPCHAVAYMLADLLEFPKQETGSKKIRNIAISELSIRPENSGLMSFFKNIEAVFPEDIIAGRYPEQGMLFFSYAREGEICSDACPGPRESCPAFGREKPKTITEYAKELRLTIPGWVFESHQMKPGIGGLKGIELKKNLLEILEFKRSFQENGNGKEFEKLESRIFFIATTCTCHGVLNLFYVTQ
ncbi:MAG: hypothetical protein QG646_1618 [Euryarchaeota archaeon]|nr:hypothetical protein [Euryarchaeota archaeon]